MKLAQTTSARLTRPTGDPGPHGPNGQSCYVLTTPVVHFWVRLTPDWALACPPMTPRIRPFRECVIRRRSGEAPISVQAARRRVWDV